MSEKRKRVGDLPLHQRTKRLLLNAGIRTTDDLVASTESRLLMIRFFGLYRLREVKRALDNIGMSVGMLRSAPDDRTE